MAIKKRLARFAVISCTHCPFENTDVIEKLLTRLSDGGPYGKITDFYHAGDLLESACASVHPNEADHTLQDEYESASSLLDNIRGVLPKDANLHWLLGNHDDNLQVNDNRRTDWQTREMLHWNRSEWAKSFLKWRQYPYRRPSVHDQRGCAQLGQVIVMHGYDAGTNSDELEGLSTAWACGGHAHRLIIRGHTHRPKDVSQCRRSAKVVLPWWTANAGTCGPTIPGYMARKDTNSWGPAIVWGECKVDTPSRFAGVEWSAQVERL
tara:strand:- start:5697 stop:6491 length:795 start_codon:yes stop_codon:yes gene_type:complete